VRHRDSWAGLVCCGAVRAEDGVWLITPEEAATPTAPPDELRLQGGTPFEVGDEAPDTGPVIEILKPSENKPLSAPLEIAIKFTPRHAPVDLSTLKVTVLKLISIDLTDRLRPFASQEGIRIADARLPSGEHTVRISLADVAGGLSRKLITVKIQ